MKKIINCLRYDIKEGTFKMLPLYLLEIAVIALFAVSDILFMKAENCEAGVLELSVKIFEGMGEYVYIKGGAPFEIPMQYLMFSFTAGIFAAFYPKREWKLRGSLYISRYQSKNIWWASKCIWCILQSFFIYLAAFLTILAVAAVNGKTSMKVGETAMLCYKQMLLENDAGLIFCYIYILGFATTLALNQCLVFFQMIFSPVISYLFFIGVIILSAYYNKPFMIGNNYMLLRTKLFCENGINLKTGIAVAFSVWTAAVFAGKWVIKKKDVL